jgi:hypothetical protein
MSKEQHPQALYQKEVMRTDADRRITRLTVFRAIEEFGEKEELGKELANAFEVYQKYENTIIPNSVDYWVENNGLQQENTRKNVLNRIFNTDIKVAREIKKSGISIKRENLSLADLIYSEEEKINKLENYLKKSLESSTHS